MFVSRNVLRGDGRPQTMGYHVLFGVLVGVWLVFTYSAEASLSSYHPSLYESTVNSDVWVRAQVVETRKNSEPFGSSASRSGEWHFFDATMKILSTTDPSLGKEIEVVVSAAESHWNPEDGERFLALRRKGPTYHWVEGSAYGVEETGGIRFVYGFDESSVDDAFAWSLLRDTRALVDGNGGVPESVRTHWGEVLYNGSPTETLLALRWFAQMRHPKIDCTMLAQNLERHHWEIEASAADMTKEIFERHGYVFKTLFNEAVRAIFETQDGEAARILEKLFDDDQRGLGILYESSILPLMITPSSGERIAQLDAVLGKSLPPYRETKYALVGMPRTDSNELLWNMVNHPSEYGGVTQLPIVEACARLVSEGDRRAVDFMNKAVTEPGYLSRYFGDDMRTSHIARLLWREYPRFERTPNARQDTLHFLAQQSRDGNRRALWSLSMMVRGGDQFLIPTLREIVLESEASQKSFIREVIRRLPSPEFVPQLKEWGGNSFNFDTVAAMLDCGALDEALAMTAPRMERPIYIGDTDDLGHELWERSTLIRMFAETDCDKEVLAWIEAEFSIERIQVYERVLLDGPFGSDWEEREQLTGLVGIGANIAVAYTLSGGEGAIPWLTWFQSKWEESRPIAIACRSSLSSEPAKLLNFETEYRADSTEHSALCISPLISLQHDEINTQLLQYINQHLPDFFWEVDFAVWRGLAVPLLRSILAALDSNNIRQRTGAVSACEAVLRQGFDYDLRESRSHNDAAVARCKAAMTGYLAGLERT